ncbi:MAG: hypothetical protein GY749_10950 [Desulfobacteraceae bacterium]|nr:hypothetical protein [Desulfobacteraceae bacterium]
MSSLSICPNCGRKAEKSFSSNWFPVHTREPIISDIARIFLLVLEDQ